MAPPPALSYDTHIYLTLTLKPDTPLFHDPRSLQSRSLPVGVTHVAQIGELQDSHIYQIDGPKSEFERVKAQVLASLREQQGVVKVEVMPEPKMRVKRSAEDL